jgi:hypothetical protein
MKAQNNKPGAGAALLENLDNGPGESSRWSICSALTARMTRSSAKVDPNAPTAVQARHAGIAFVNLISTRPRSPESAMP